MERHHFSKKLLAWYKQHQRVLPWRKGKEAVAYEVWLSEIILQQTRVLQGLPYYKRMLTAFPTLEQLAEAREEEVLFHWQGLGYYSRARNLHKCAQHIVKTLGGKFPMTYADLQKLPGIGPYTAAAIASIVFHVPVPTLDGNVYRVLSRVFGIDASISQSAGKRRFQTFAQLLLDVEHPGDFNQALMEFGALHCTPHKPLCDDCIFHKTCVARQTQQQHAFPVKAKKKPARARYFHYLVLARKQQIYLKQRRGKDIWHGLYDFYLIESEMPHTFEQLSDPLVDILKSAGATEKSSFFSRHQLTHQTIHALFFHIDLPESCLLHLPALNLFPFLLTEIQQLPLPVLISQFLAQLAFP